MLEFAAPDHLTHSMPCPTPSLKGGGVVRQLDALPAVVLPNHGVRQVRQTGICLDGKRITQPC
jgi:hypothetical protein